MAITPQTHRALPYGIDDPFLLGFLDHFLVDGRIPLLCRDVGQLQGGDRDDLGSLWQCRSVDQLFFYPKRFY